MMPILRAAIVLAILSAVFAGALRMMGLDTLIEVVNGVTVFACVMLIILYIPLWFPAVKGNLDAPSRLGLGGLFLVLSVLCSRSWAMVWRVSDFPEWMRTHWSVALWPFLAVIGCAILITVPSNLDGSVQRRSWVLLLASIALGALSAGIVIGVRWADVITGAMPG